MRVKQAVFQVVFIVLGGALTSTLLVLLAMSNIGCSLFGGEYIHCWTCSGSACIQTSILVPLSQKCGEIETSKYYSLKENCEVAPDTSCTKPTGACCDYDGGSCKDNVTRMKCDEYHGTFYGGDRCDDHTECP